MNPDTGPFAICETYSEVLVALFRLDGLQAVDQMLAQADLPKQALQKAAREVKRVGMTELSDAITAHA
jgi:hypothetical protein